jgi:ribosome biogenesis protein Nip4
MQTKKEKYTLKANSVFHFISQLNAQLPIDPDLIVEKNGRFFLINNTSRLLTTRDFFYAGAFLGKAKDGKFFPSFILLSMLAKKKESNRVVVDKKAAWLFICGRDILGKSIVRVHGQGKKGANTLVLNEFGECLGFGRIAGKVTGSGVGNELVVKNVSDIGDFLRRER